VISQRSINRAVYDVMDLEKFYCVQYASSYQVFSFVF
jgi:hypothetical protein